LRVVIEAVLDRANVGRTAAGADEAMALLKVKPTTPDMAIARTVARNTSPLAEVVARGLTWGADECSPRPAGSRRERKTNPLGVQPTML
jgi:hypothetical protein